MTSATSVRTRVDEADLRELDRFADYLRRVAGALGAGVPAAEAVLAIYPDVYPEDDGRGYVFGRRP